MEKKGSSSNKESEQRELAELREEQMNNIKRLIEELETAPIVKNYVHQVQTLTYGHDGLPDYDKIHCVFTSRINFTKPAVPIKKWMVGQRVVEVFAMYLFNLTGNELQIFGKIEFGDKNFSTFIYDRPEKSFELLAPYEAKSLLLTGADILLPVYDFSISACLCDSKTKNVVNTGYADYDCKQKADTPEVFFLCLRPRAREDTDGRPLTQLVAHYVRHEDALGAKVYVTLPESSESATIFGTITAASRLYPHCESVLFRKREEEKVTIEPGGSVELSKGLVAVPVQEIFMIALRLCDGKIGTAVFRPTLSLLTGADPPKMRIGGFDISLQWMR